MLDLSHIPNSQQDIQIFYANQGDRGYQTWRKPRKCNFVYILSIDGGAGGFSGNSSPINTAVPSTPSGGSGAVTRALINSSFVPDILYVKVGKGGVGGASTTGGGNTQSAGGAGESSGIFLLPNLFSQSNINEAASFLGGSISATPGAGAAASVLANNYLLGLTNVLSLAGRAVGAGTFSGVSVDPLISLIVMPGAIGGGIDTGFNPFPGGNINASSISPIIPGGASGAITGNGGNGENGYTSWKPFFSLGGAGGGSSSTPGGNGGNGGDGGIGSGGGSGGSTYLGTSGKGGNGGDGVVIIISF